MLEAAHRIYVWVFILAPAVALVWALAGRAGAPGVRRRRFVRVMGAFLIGLAIGAALEFGYARAGAGRVRWDQAALTGYFAASLLLILRALDAALRWATRRVFGIRSGADAPPQGFFRHLGAAVVRMVLLVAVGLPFVTAAALTYRPKIAPEQTPRTQFGFDYEPVSFQATDGVRISGWWIPSPRPRSRNGRRTVVVCHGMASNKADQFLLARDLVPAGYNVLAIDFRGHGESDGQLASFGALERNDVLGAVRWVRQQRPQAARRIFGVGVSTGAAALLAAAADPSEEGRAIDAVVAYGGFARLRGVFGTMASNVFARPASAYVVALALPMASLQTGANLSAFAPGDFADRLWPRPILVLHGIADPVVPWEQGEALYRAAGQPKDYLWRDREGHYDLLADDGAAAYVVWFLNNAQPVPVI